MFKVPYGRFKGFKGFKSLRGLRRGAAALKLLELLRLCRLELLKLFKLLELCARQVAISYFFDKVDFVFLLVARDSPSELGLSSRSCVGSLFQLKAFGIQYIVLFN